MRRAITAAGLLVLAYVLGTFLDVWWASRQDTTDPVEAAVVLGAAQYNGVPSPALAGRLDHAAELHALGQVEVIVVTGGGQAGDATTEAKAGYDYLRAAGIPDEDLKLEVQGTSTYESLAATARFLREEGITDIVLVTDPYHARRSQLVAAEVGLDAAVSPTDASSDLSRLTRETIAVGLGRIIGFRRLERLA
ncbi:MAG: YdcF family protein [Acidimicrobiales bacterium]